MSLYGSGRAEGVVAAIGIACFVAVVFALGSWQVTAFGQIDWTTTAINALAPATGGLLCYRFLRASGRSRYAAFLVGTMYALSPWFVSMAVMPKEQVAAALAPLALEATYRLSRPSQRWLWLPMLAPCLALPFVAGLTVVGGITAVLAFAGLAYALRCEERDGRKRLLWQLAGAVALAATAAASFVLIDPFAGALFQSVTPLPAEVLAAHRASHLGLDTAALLRLPGPVLLLFAALGILRRQRHADIFTWLALGALGALPAFAATLFDPKWFGLDQLPIPVAVQSAAFWLTLLACAMLGAAGLDDFLELPLRRRTALPWLLAFAVAGAPLILAFGSHAPRQEWPLTATFLVFALLLPTWRRIGILRFKNVLTVVALLAVAVPVLQVLPTGPGAALPAMPFAETALQSYVRDLQILSGRPWWHYAGLLSVLASTSIWLLSASLRRRNASMIPIKPHRAMAKKAPPAKRS